MISSSGDGWMRLYDEIQQHYYWYNTVTQESQWEEAAFEGGSNESSLRLTAAEASQAKAFFDPDALPDQPNEGWRDNSPSEDWLAVQQIQWQELGMTPSPSEPLTVSSGTSEQAIAPAADTLTSDEEEVQSPILHSEFRGQADRASGQPAPPPVPPLRKDVPNRAPCKEDKLGGSNRSGSSGRVGAIEQPEASSGDRDEDLEADAAPMLPPGRSRLRYLNVMADTKRDLECYRGCFFFHAFVCETPMVLLEASLRCAANFMIGVFLATLAAVFVLAALARERRRRHQLWTGAPIHGQNGSSTYNDQVLESRNSRRVRDEGIPPAAREGAAPEAMAWAAAKVFFRDSALCFAVVLTLSVLPCCLACGVYRDFQADDDDSDSDGDDDDVDDDIISRRDSDEEALGSRGSGGGDVRAGSSGRGWHLRPIPTFLGAVDPRRFATVSLCGQGADARNANIAMPASDTLATQNYLASAIAANVTDASGSLDGTDLRRDSSSRNRSDGTNNGDSGSYRKGCLPGCWDIRGAVLLPPRNLDRGMPPAAAWLMRQLLSFCDAAESQEAAVADGRGGYSAELAQVATSDSEDEYEKGEEEIDIVDAFDYKPSGREVEPTTTEARKH